MAEMLNQDHRVILGYWKCRGLASNIRYQCEYSGIKYEMVEYEQGDGPDFSRQDWLDKKFNLGLDFPNLPYLIDGDLSITETMAIHRYLADKYKPELMGSDTVQRAQIGMLEGILKDVTMASAMPCYTGDDKQVVFDKMSELLPPIVNFLGSKKFLCGDEPVYVDFFFFERLNLLKFLYGDRWSTEFPTLEEYCQNVANLPGLKEYLESPDCLEKSRALNNKVAKINNSV
eukprot:CAMPEP_0113952318 /NCGR_PEP_ID=MMETSP1339-20121228/90341_1 /TAXON_ID=94617 /ORGANISM="Fibrocapsa japonica" /LENGTH=229 /DNA_ID=CAMNT_0000960899 /DNA_START=125 /DNA_END=814 /DNA_ORIENTATION=+ /assembly_acc=CAM_ASM_000762